MRIRGEERADHVTKDVDSLLPDQESEATSNDDDKESHRSDKEHPLRQKFSSDVRWSGNRGVSL